MKLFAELQDSLNRIAPNLFETGATQAVHDAFERLAFQYADNAGLAFGTHSEADKESRNKDSRERIVVHRSGQSIWPFERSTQGQFMFDHCWLVYFNSKEPPPREGRLSRCELVMESEWEFDSDHEGPEYRFLQDFRKTLVSSAQWKVFIFRSKTVDWQEKTFEKLKAEIDSFRTSQYSAGSYLLCSWFDNAFAYVTSP